ncbi:unnamed protein product [Diabrotica balteata]|uniref:Uncharacterized protein n=1 Tax=Diabrotica balteata TaxID=107213 RepID=A0A9N9X7M2_DIABA|nr:unnamed protein product [Diabrotica balteata]
MNSKYIQIIAIFTILHAIFVYADVETLKSSLSDELDPLQDTENSEEIIKEQEKRTIFKPLIKNVAWVKHKPVKYVLGYGPPEVKIKPVLRPVAIKHLGYHYNKPKIHFHLKRPIVHIPHLRPVLEPEWKPIIKPVASLVKPVHIIKPVKPVHVEHIHAVKPVHHVHVEPVHADHLHLNPVPHIDHLHREPVVQVEHIQPVHVTDHVHHVTTGHVNHLHHIAAPHLHAVHPGVVPAPFVPSAQLFEVTKPDLGVLPLGAAFPTTALKEIPAPQLVPHPVLPVPNPVHVHPFLPLPAPVPVVPSPVPIAPAPVHIAPVQHVHPVGSVHPAHLPVTHLHPVDHVHPVGHIHTAEPVPEHIHAGNHPYPVEHVHPLAHLHQDHLHVGQLHQDHLHVGQLHQDHLHVGQFHQDHAQAVGHQDHVHLGHVHLGQLHQDHTHAVHPEHVHLGQLHQDHVHPVGHLHQDIHLGQIHQDHIHPLAHLHPQPGVQVDYHGTHILNSLGPEQPPTQHLLPNHYHLQYPQIPQHQAPNHEVPLEGQPNYADGSQNGYNQQVPQGQGQPQFNGYPNQFQQDTPNIQDHYPNPQEDNRYQLAHQVSSQQFFREGQFQIGNQNEDQGYSYPQPAGRFIQPGQTDVQFPLHLPNHPGFNRGYEQDNQQEASQQHERAFKPSIQLEPPFKK